MRLKTAGVASLALICFGCSPPPDLAKPWPTNTLKAHSIRSKPHSNMFVPSASDKFDSHLNLAYVNSSEKNQELDLFIPKHKNGEPLLIFIHGGAWIGGDKGAYAKLAATFANDGIAVADLNYRLSPGVQNPEHVKDASKAYGWLVSNAGKYGYDATKIYVSGHSAGAHNAAMMATGTFLHDAGVPAKNLPAGFIGYEGIYDIPLLVENFPTYANWFIKYAFSPERDKWTSGSPAQHALVLKAPWLVVHSVKDQLVDQAQADAFVAQLAKSRVKHEAIFADFGNHDQVMIELMEPKGELRRKVLGFVKAGRE